MRVLALIAVEIFPFKLYEKKSELFLFLGSFLSREKIKAEQAVLSLVIKDIIFDEDVGVQFYVLNSPQNNWPKGASLN